jgi:SAM-dependent methyltransferase
VPLKSHLKAAIEPRFAGQLRRSLHRVAPSLTRYSQYWPYRQDPATYSLVAGNTAHAAAPLPPQSLWAGYGTSADSYLASGREDCLAMRKILANSGAVLGKTGPILDLGCATGRMIRHLADEASQVEIWGCDIWADALIWCQENLSPPFWFATTTTIPHLPFEDRSFGLVYCGSLFTHIDDLADAWFLELRRILRPGGYLYFSVNDRNAIRVFEGNSAADRYPRYYERTGGKENWDMFVSGISREPDYQRFRNGEAWMVSLGRQSISQVMWDTDVLCQRLSYGWNLCSINPESYGHQPTVLLERT